MESETDLQAELTRLREEDAAWQNAYDTVYRERDTLLAALNKAGDRLAQVQPGVTEPWAYDIVPLAEQEIAAAISEVEGEKT